MLISEPLKISANFGGNKDLFDEDAPSSQFSLQWGEIKVILI